MTHECYSKVDQQRLVKNWPTTVTQKLIHRRYWKEIHNCYSILNNNHGIQKCSKTITLSWPFFDWKKAATVLFADFSNCFHMILHKSNFIPW